jgi:hypothetical protein
MPPALAPQPLVGVKTATIGFVPTLIVLSTVIVAWPEASSDTGEVIAAVPSYRPTEPVGVPVLRLATVTLKVGWSVVDTVPVGPVNVVVVGSVMTIWLIVDDLLVAKDPLGL